MTAVATYVLERPISAKTAPNFLWLLPSSILAFVYPGLARSWTGVSLFRAACIAFFNVVAAGVWCTLIVLASYVWRDNLAIDKALGSVWSIDAFGYAAERFLHLFHEEWAKANFFDRFSPFVGVFAMVVAAFLLPYFVILPFATRPGPNKACVRHVARTVFMGSGVIHWWGAAYVTLLLAYSSMDMPGFIADYARALTPLLLAFTILSLWSLVVLGYAARQEYRSPAEHAEPHDPWCDDCGYTLTGIDPEGRCPECGRPITDSIGPHNRPPTAWENRPSLLNFPVIASQVKAIVLRPRSLFFSMPTLTGQFAAQRWLLASAAVLFVLALPIVPVLYVVLDAEWNLAVVASSLAMGLVWAVFGVMMVGVETAGIATFSRLRKHKVYLSTASKVTSYSTLLMVPWIILGGIQLVTYTYLESQHTLNKLFHLGLRGEQVALAGSLALAHIGGLLWYELTVYRGIRAIQYANK